MNFPSLYYFLHVVLKILAVTVLAFSGSIWVKMNLNSDTGGFILSSLIAIIITVAFSAFLIISHIVKKKRNRNTKIKTNERVNKTDDES